MSYPLQIVLAESPEEEVGLLETTENIIGREPEAGGLKVHNPAVSREHGIFTPFGNYWLYRDLGSTNGSWLNGVRLAPHHFKIVRGGDVIQLADTSYLLKGAARGGNERSLLVIQQGAVQQEFVVPAHGRALAIGGPDADLPLSSDADQSASLVIEGRGDRPYAYQDSESATIIHNGIKRSGVIPLAHNDDLVLGQYTILVQEARGLSPVRRPTPARKPMPEPEFEEETPASDSTGSTTVFRQLEDNVIVFIGFLLVLALLFGLAWYVFS